jgi:hypothetical protein
MAKEKLSFIKATLTNKHREVINPNTLQYARISVRLCYVPHSACGVPLFPAAAVCFSKDTPS